MFILASWCSETSTTIGLVVLAAITVITLLMPSHALESMHLHLFDIIWSWGRLNSPDECQVCSIYSREKQRNRQSSGFMYLPRECVIAPLTTVAVLSDVCSERSLSANINIVSTHKIVFGELSRLYMHYMDSKVWNIYGIRTNIKYGRKCVHAMTSYWMM